MITACQMGVAAGPASERRADPALEIVSRSVRRASRGDPVGLPRLWWVIEELVPDGLWRRIAPLLPPPKPRRHRYPGRRPIDDRAALAGIVFVLKTGITWNQLPASLVG